MPKSGKSTLTQEEVDDANRLRALWDMPARKARLSQKDFAARYDVGTPSYVSQLLTGHRPLNAEVASKFAHAMRCSVSDFSPRLAREIRSLSSTFSPKSPRSGSPGEPAAAYSPSVPVRGIAHMDDRAIWRSEDMESSPTSVHWFGTPGAYALQLHGDAMQPRYRSGTFVVIRDDRDCEPGSDVLVVLKDGNAMIRELASISDGSIVLRRLRDGERQTLARTDVHFMHRVVGQVDQSEIVLTGKTR